MDPDFVPEGWLDPPPPPTPPKKKLKLSLAKKKTECTSELSASKASRFATPVSEKEVNEAAIGVVPTNTKKNNAWAIIPNRALLCQTVLYYPKLCSIFPNWISGLDMLTHCGVWHLE